MLGFDHADVASCIDVGDSPVLPNGQRYYPPGFDLRGQNQSARGHWRQFHEARRCISPRRLPTRRRWFLAGSAYYNKPTQEGYSSISRPSPKHATSAVLYSIPGRCGVEIAVETVKRLAASCKTVIGIKRSGWQSRSG